tara:strand:- start:26 stop:781 length:756 start_codon:yes stop_codon:yes gene_type:complete
MKKIFFLIIFLSFSVMGREQGQTEITTEEGIEVFQKEKYYLLKKNVLIESDDFILSADLVKAFFDKDLYDIQKIESEGNVNFTSSKGYNGIGERLDFSIKNNLMNIFGNNALLNMNNLIMKSDNYIMIDDSKGKFKLEGNISELSTDTMNIIGSYIDGSYQEINSINEINNLIVKSDEITEITTDTLKMFSLKAVYSKKDNIIELFDNVKVIRNNEIIMGDYAKINTLNESYKVSSKESNKVKVLIDNTNE